MSAYLTPSELEAGLEPELVEALGDAAAVAELLERASGDVDVAVGGPRDPVTGRAVDLALLAPAQAAAVRRATVEAASYRLSDAQSIRGGEQFIGEGLSVVRRGPQPPTPATVAALVGVGLIRRQLVAALPPPIPTPLA